MTSFIAYAAIAEEVYSTLSELRANDCNDYADGINEDMFDLLAEAERLFRLIKSAKGFLTVHRFLSLGPGTSAFVSISNGLDGLPATIDPDGNVMITFPMGQVVACPVNHIIRAESITEA